MPKEAPFGWKAANCYIVDQPQSYGCILSKVNSGTTEGQVQSRTGIGADHVESCVTDRRRNYVQD